jgi:hypothetical protein
MMLLKFICFNSQLLQLCVIVLFPTFINSSAFGQKFNLEIATGASLSQISGDGTSGFRQIGMNAGAYLFYDWKEDWKLNTGLLFHQKGARKFITAESITTYNLRTNYIDVPFTINYLFKEFQFNIGPSFNFLINYKEHTNFGEVDTDRQFDRFELSINGGVAYSFRENWNVFLVYQNSLLPVREHVAGYSIMPATNSFLVELYYNLYNLGQYHSLFALQIRYRLGKV